MFQREISGWLRGETRVTARMLQRIRDRVQKWYHDEGYACAQVVNFGNLNTNEVVCEVVEGDITQLQIQFQDRLGFPSIGHTQQKIIQRELPDQVSLNPCWIVCNSREQLWPSLMFVILSMCGVYSMQHWFVNWSITFIMNL